MSAARRLATCCSRTARASTASSAAPRRRRRRGRLHDRHDRLPGVDHRPVVRRPADHLHLPAHRQLRRQRGSDGVRPRPCARAAIMRAAVNREDAPERRARLARLAGDCGVPAITGVDTRALVRHIRDAGAMRGGVFPAACREGRRSS